jgi:glycogen debranching enzyme
MHYRIDLDGRLSEKEFLLTDGSGSFAMGTLSGVATRRYHSMLTAALRPPVGRVNLLNRVGELLRVQGETEAVHELSVCRFGGHLHPLGHQYLKRFELGESDEGGNCARWTYEAGGARVIKTLRLPPMSFQAELTYEVTPPKGRHVELSLLPMVSLRDFHSLRRSAGHPMGVSELPGGIRVEADGQAVQILAEGAEFHVEPDWWFGHSYSIETERGQDDTEDLFKPGVFRAEFARAGKVRLLISPGGKPEALGAAFPPAKLPPSASPTLRRLAWATGDFLIRRRNPKGKVGTSILAGFPWFADWGRDTFISLEGLLLTTGRLQEAGEVLSTFAEYVDQGMIPNKFDDYSNQPEYNTVDASLWFIHAAHQFVSAGGDRKLFERSLLPACREIIRGYRDGTLYHIGMDPSDGLVSQGDSSTQLTWMDAKYQGRAFTPRPGKPVEINALWYHALRLLREDAIADRVAASFARTFWISPQQGLADTVEGDRRDTSCRPNQIFAVSLPHSPLSPEQQKAVVDVVGRELLTPLGLRTLSPSASHYKPTYGGPQSQRDEAYHNGTVWPWLIGPFVDAVLKVEGDTREAREGARRLLMPLLEHLHDACIGHVSEIMEAQPPHRAVGACAQAWSLAEVLRVAVKLGV